MAEALIEKGPMLGAFPTDGAEAAAIAGEAEMQSAWLQAQIRRRVVRSEEKAWRSTPS